MKFNNMGMVVAACFVRSITGAQSANGKAETIGPVTGSYLLDCAFAPLEIAKGEQTRMAVLSQSLAATEEKAFRAAVKDFMTKALEAKKNPNTTKVRASEMRTMYRAIRATGSNAVIDGKGWHDAVSASRAKLEEMNITTSGKEKQTKEERAETLEEKAIRGQVDAATVLAKKAGANLRDPKFFAGKEWAGFMAQAEVDIRTEWAATYAAGVVKTFGLDHAEALSMALDKIAIEAEEKAKAEAAAKVKKAA